MTTTTLIIFACAAAYLIGSIPSSVWIGKAFFGIDVREHGSRNAGATNTLRTLGRGAGFTVLGIDFLKGFVAANLVYWQGMLTTSPNLLEYKMMFGAFAVLGHIYPVFAGFRGGKGIATLIGVVTAMDWQLALVCFAVFVIIVAVSKFISLGSMSAAILSPVIAGLLHRWTEHSLIWFCLVVAALVVYTHRANIRRLVKGEENRFSLAKK